MTARCSSRPRPSCHRAPASSHLDALDRGLIEARTQAARANARAAVLERDLKQVCADLAGALSRLGVTQADIDATPLPGPAEPESARIYEFPGRSAS